MYLFLTVPLCAYLCLKLPTCLLYVSLSYDGVGGFISRWVVKIRLGYERWISLSAMNKAWFPKGWVWGNYFVRIHRCKAIFTISRNSIDWHERCHLIPLKHVTTCNFSKFNTLPLEHINLPLPFKVQTLPP